MKTYTFKSLAEAITSLRWDFPSDTAKYKGYTIQSDQRNPYGEAEIMIYRTSQGIQHDADFDGESFRYCGNCQWFDTIEEAMEEIDFVIAERKWKLLMKYRDLQIPYATSEKQIAINRIVAMLNRMVEHKIESVGLGVGKPNY